MKISLTLITLLLVVTCFAQTPQVNFNDCKQDNLMVFAQYKPKWDVKNGSLADYMNIKFKKNKKFKGANGHLKMKFIVFNDGTICCTQIVNLTEAKIEGTQFQKIINEMPPWRPGSQNKKPINFLHKLSLKIVDGKFI